MTQCSIARRGRALRRLAVHGIIAMEDHIRGLDRETKLIQAAGHYYERYRFEDDAWRIAETKLVRLFRNSE